MPGILHYVLNHVSTDYLFQQINGLRRFTSIVLSKEAEKGFKYKHFYTLDTDLKSVKKRVAEYEIKAIHAHFGHHGEKAVHLAKLVNLPLITSIRGGEACNHPQKLAKNRWRYAQVIEYGALFLPVCQYFIPLLESIWVSPKKKLDVCMVELM